NDTLPPKALSASSALPSVSSAIMGLLEVLQGLLDQRHVRAGLVVEALAVPYEVDPRLPVERVHEDAEGGWAVLGLPVLVEPQEMVRVLDPHPGLVGEGRVLGRGRRELRADWPAIGAVRGEVVA